MGVFIIEQDKILFQTRDEIVCLEAYGKNCVRFRSSTNMQFSEQSYTLLPKEPCTVSCRIEGNTAVLENGILKAIITEQGRVTYYKKDVLLLSDLAECSGRTPARQYTHIGGDCYRTQLTFNAYSNEHFYGLGDDEHDCFDLKGAALDLFHKNTKTTIPFVYSSRGYGFLWNNPSIGEVQFASNRTVWRANETNQADYLIIAGDTPSDVLERYGHLTGFAPVFPSWASGFWQCKLRYTSQEEVLRIAHEYKKRNIPLSVIIIDFFHWTQQGDWKFDPTFWPNPKAMVDELKSMGIEPCVSVWPTVHPESENFKYMDEHNMLIRTEKGTFDIFHFHGPLTYVDCTNPQAREFMWEIVKKNYFDLGIKLFWLDQAEPEFFPAHYDNLKLYLGNGNQFGSLYPFCYQQLFYDGLKKEGVEDICVLTRAGWAGSQRTGALLWSGDVESSFTSLKRQVKNGLNMGMCGIPWWNSDIGGFWGGNPDDADFRELLIRWFQYGVFCPVTRLHGDRVWTVRPEDTLMQPTGADNELWSYGDTVYSILKALVRLRERLRPYIHRQMKAASAYLTPIMRPMFFDFKEDICYSLDDQYMFGSDILFAPIIVKNQTERRVYLPKGPVWIDVRNKEEYTGGQWLTCTAQLHELIAFVKKDTVDLDLFSDIQN